MKAGMNPIVRNAAGCLLGALVAGGALAQSTIPDSITPTLFKGYHEKLFVQAGNGRGFTVNPDPAVPRKPTKQHNLARDYILNTFRGMGINARLQKFDFDTSFGGDSFYYTNCNNVIATIPGTDPQNAGYYIITAYYDTLDAGQPNPDGFAAPAPKSAGADMNASGVAALLSIADALKGRKFRATIILIAFDAALKNFAGSDFYVAKSTTAIPGGTAKKIDRALIRAMVSVDTIGYARKVDGTTETVLMYGGSEIPDQARLRVAKAIKTYGGLDVVQGGVILGGDHVAFWDAGVPAMSVQEASAWINPHVYTANDNMSTPKIINYAYATKITKGLCGFLATRAGLQ